MAETTETPTKKGRPAGTKTRGKTVVPIKPDAKKQPPAPQDSPPGAAAGAVEPAEPAATPDDTEVSLEPFPMPPRGKGKGGYCDTEEGMQYWRSLPAKFINRCSVYINRELPVLNRLLELDDDTLELIRQKKKREPAKYIDKPPKPFGENTRMEFLSRYGSGTYKVYVNDAGVKGKRSETPDLASRNLCKFWVEVWDTDFPPVLDPSRADKGLAILDLLHPKNASYVHDLRIKGVLPREKRSDEEMAQSEVINKLTDQVGELANEVAQGKTDRMVDELKAEIRANKGGGDDTMKLVLQLLIAERAQPKQPAGPDPIATMMQNQINALTTELQAERAERRKYEDAIRDRANQQPPDPFQYFDRMVQQFDRFKQFFSAASNGGAAAPAVVKPSKMSGTQEFFSEVLPRIFESPIINALAARISAGNGGSIPTTTAATTTGGAAAGAAAGAQHTGPTEKELIEWVNIAITPAMVDYLENQQSGTEFAKWVYNGYPDRIQALQHMTHAAVPGQAGAPVIIALYRLSGNLWREFLQPREAQFTTFVQEFCAFRPEGTAEPEAPATVETTAEAGEATPMPASVNGVDASHVPQFQGDF